MQLLRIAKFELARVLTGRFRRLLRLRVRSVINHTGTSISIALKCGITRTAALRTGRLRCTDHFDCRASVSDAVIASTQGPIERTNLSCLWPSQCNAQHDENRSDPSCNDRNDRTE